jgi:hypothetical protein
MLGLFLSLLLHTFTHHGHPIDEVNVVEGSHVKLILSAKERDRRGRYLHYELLANGSKIRIHTTASPHFANQTVTLTGVDETDEPVSLYATFNGEMSDVSPINVHVLKRLELPHEATDEGMVARVLLSEARSPIQTRHPDRVFESMMMMKRVLDNRLKAGLENEDWGRWIVGVSRVENLRTVIAAPGQIHGFEYGGVNPEQEKNINYLVRKANDSLNVPPRLLQRYRVHVERAIEIASLMLADEEITNKSLLHWRTHNASPPVPRYSVLSVTIEGNSFFTLKSGWLNSPDHPRDVP